MLQSQTPRPSHHCSAAAGSSGLALAGVSRTRYLQRDVRYDLTLWITWTMSLPQWYIIALSN